MTTETTQCTDLNVNELATLPTPTNLSGLPMLAERVTLMEVSTPLNDVMDLRESLTFMASRIKELRETLDAKLQTWIEANGSIKIGTRCIYVGTKKDTKCKALKPALQALLESSGGDWDVFAECLSANAIKYGAAKTVMGEAIWDQHFEVVTKTELKEGEDKPKPVKQIVDFDEKFIAKTKRSK